MNNADVKRLALSDVLDATKDAHSLATVSGEHKLFHTEVTMTDETGRVCFAKRSNLIVLRGRTFTLEKLFDDTIGTTGVNTGNFPYKSDNARKIIAFGVGKGGTPASDPFAPYAPSPTGLWLADHIPFRLHDTAAAADGDPLTFVPAAERVNYGGGVAVTGQATQTLYRLKHFVNRDPEWFFNADQNTVYKSLTLSITKDDCRTSSSNMINELMLVMSRQTGTDANGAAQFANPEIFSRITFPTEYLYENKALEVNYKLYA